MQRIKLLTLSILLGVVLGLIVGLIVYGIAVLTMSWLNESQLKMIVPGFIIIGFFVGLIGAIPDLVKK